MRGLTLYFGNVTYIVQGLLKSWPRARQNKEIPIVHKSVRQLHTGNEETRWWCFQAYQGKLGSHWTMFR
jgi:hypothetical protein